MVLNKDSPTQQEETCFYTCALGYVEANIDGTNIDFLVDSGSQVNFIPHSMAINIGLEFVKLEMKITGVGGDRFDIPLVSIITAEV